MLGFKDTRYTTPVTGDSRTQGLEDRQPENSRSKDSDSSSSCSMCCTAAVMAE